MCPTVTFSILYLRTRVFLKFRKNVFLKELWNLFNLKKKWLGLLNKYKFPLPPLPPSHYSLLSGGQRADSLVKTGQHVAKRARMGR